MLQKLDDDILENVTGGSGPNYDIESDPLFNRFKEVWDSSDEHSSDGMSSRSSLIRSFRKWINETTPDQIKGVSDDLNGMVNRRA